MNQSEHMKRHVFHELEQSSAWAKGSFYVIHYLVGFYSYCRCEERLEASEQQHQPTPSDDLQRQQQQAAAADVATCLRKSSPATCKVLPAMSPLDVASALPASMCVWQAPARSGLGVVLSGFILARIPSLMTLFVGERAPGKRSSNRRDGGPAVLATFL